MRAFFAVPVPAAVRRRLEDLQSSLRATLGGVRWVRPDAVHLTLIFLGEIERERAAALAEAAERVCGDIRPAVARVGGVGCFPPRASPRVLWVGVREEGERALANLHRGLAATVSSHGIEVEARPFSPHLTLGRARVRLSRRAVERSVAALGEPDLGELPVDHCILYRSILGEGGARYEPQSTARLGSTGR